MVKSVLAGALETAEGRAAITEAVAQATASGAILHLVGFVEPPKGDAKVESYASDVERLEERVLELAERLVPNNVTVKAHVPTGVTHPSDAVLRVAANEGVDLIVIGMRERSRVGKLVLGSNAQNILMGAPCPVLSVKASEDEA